MTTKITVVIPVMNEAENIASLIDEIQASIKNISHEIIVVDDGSTDNTLKVLQEIKKIKIIVFNKNFGQTAAFDAGIKASKGQYIVTIDGDGQNDPADIPALLSYLQEHDLDIVSGWRKNRKDTFAKKFVSRGANLLRKILLNDTIHDSGCSLKIYKRECFDNVDLYGEMHRFIPALLSIQGYRVGETVVNHRPRLHGRTKYNWKRTIKGFLDMASIWFWRRYSARPLHLLGSLGLIMFAIGSVFLLRVIYLVIVGPYNNFSLVMTAFFYVAGIQLFVFGLIADILNKVYYRTHHSTFYRIKKTIDND